MPPTIAHGGDLKAQKWRQFISNKGWIGDLSAGPDGVHAPMTIDVPWGDLLAVMVAVLGKHKADGKKIDRTNPMRHPVFNWCYCTRITSLQGIKFKGIDKKNLGDVPIYDSARLTLQFNSMPYDMNDNLSTPAEHRRYVQRFEKPAGEYIARAKGNFVYLDVPDGYERNFPSQRGMLIVKNRLTWVWHYVPVIGLYDDNGRKANIDPCLGRVNNASFAGYPAGTLLLEGTDIEPVPSPIDPALANFLGTGNPYAKVTFSLLFFDPPTGPPGHVPPTADPTRRGHNLAPHPKDSLFYPVGTSVAAQIPALQYQLADFSTLFEMCT